MPPNLESTKTRARYVWKYRGAIFVSLPSLPRAFEALCRLSEQGRLADYDGYTNERHWIKFDPERVADWRHTETKHHHHQHTHH